MKSQSNFSQNLFPELEKFWNADRTSKYPDNQRNSELKQWWWWWWWRQRWWWWLTMVLGVEPRASHMLGRHSVLFHTWPQSLSSSVVATLATQVTKPVTTTTPPPDPALWLFITSPKSVSLRETGAPKGFFAVPYHRCPRINWVTLHHKKERCTTRLTSLGCVSHWF